VWPWQRLASQQLTLKQQKGKNTHKNKRKKKQNKTKLDDEKLDYN
jgi:hypothetical protein